MEYRPVGIQRRLIFCPVKEYIDQYLHNKFEIPSLEKYIQLLESEDTTRSEAVKAASDSKVKQVRLVKGFLLNCYDNIIGNLHHEIINLKPTQGSFVFVRDYEHFTIPADVTVVVVEGYENFLEINKQRYLFEGIKPLFIWRYQNSISISSWINQIPNPYIHFGDFDPKGLHIYVSEFKNKVGADRCKFLIPDNIESLLSRHGERDLYEKQIESLSNYPFEEHLEIKDLILLIKRIKKGLAQEILIPE
ncbi:MAG TPA: hypothetical protein VIN08_06275 [Ohtaekwangia sp.]|uniref:DUF7281 domain-containing protein n=1 Tax=Ohtaekwangia sp. TaxID=2066019 RepID=UPI002F91C357